MPSENSRQGCNIVELEFIGSAKVDTDYRTEHQA
jgi:hypothetical protein